MSDSMKCLGCGTDRSSLKLDMHGVTLRMCQSCWQQWIPSPERKAFFAILGKFTTRMSEDRNEKDSA